MKIQKNISLQPYNTFNIDAKAARFFTLNSADDLNELQKDTQWQTTPKFILGGGSNILLTKDYPGLVIYNQLKGITTVDENNEYIWLKIAAGENWHQFVMYCVEHGYGGVENLSLIPGTVGAAPMQNIGAYGVEIRSVFESLDAIELATGKLKTFNNADCQFDYRQSIFKTALKNQFIITHVTLKLNKKPELNTHYGAIKDVLKSENKQPSIRNISDAVIKIRQSKLPDPKKIPNAGSFFKNPYITQEQFNLLKQQFPEIPHYDAPHSLIKIPAGWLIEQCGWKGKTLGNVGVHEHQALVLVNRDNANGKEIQTLAESIQQSVLEKFQISLSAEVNIY